MNELAVCCSGGGIRSASYCLGALQALQQAKVMDRVSRILGVSGGSYIAASRALVANDLLGRNESDPAYAPGTPEERNLRNNTHYLAPDAAVALTGVMSLLLGTAVTLVLVYAPLYAFAHAWGWLLRWQAVLAPSRHHPLAASFPAWTVAVPIAAGAITLILFGWWWFALARRTASSGRGSEHAAWVWRAALAAVVLAAVLLAVPAADAWLFSLSSNGAFGTIVHFFGFGRAVSWSPGALAGLVAAIMAVARFCQTGLGKWHALAGAQRTAAGGGQAPAGQGKGATAGAGSASSPGLLTRAGMWARQKLQPWIGTAVIVLAILVAALLWTGDGARAGFSAAQLRPVLAAAVVALVLSFLSDVNRTSMHGFYRWRLASAYAVTREAARTQQPADRRKAAATRLSELKTAGPGTPELVICATANINAARETPSGQGGFCLTFDHEEVALHREAGSSETEPARASTADYEALIGHDRFTLFDLSAISGAAVSPLMGSATRHAYRILFTAANIRLGVWLPHPRILAKAREPGKGADDSWWARHPTLLLLWYRTRHPLWARHTERNGRREARLWAHVLNARSDIGKSRWRRFRGALWYHAMQPTLGMLWAEAAGHLSYRSTWMYVTDGGHYDNLGLVEALRRGAEHILVLDASGDKADTWFTLGTAIALARADEGVEITLDPPWMTRGGGRLRAGEVVRPWVQGTFTRHADARALPRTGTITVCKLAWWLQAPWDVRAYAAHHPEYPGNSTLEQLYDGAEFEAYRELGAAAVRAALAGEPKVGGQVALAGHVSPAGH